MTTTTNTMQAWSQDRYGGPDVLTLTRRDVPQPGAGEVLVRVTATSLNSADLRILRGDPLLVRLAYGLRRPRTPVPGRDVAGVVECVGGDVSDLAVGDRVVGDLAGGGLGTHVVAPADKLRRIPDALDDRTAATLPLAGGTAWQALDLAGIGTDSSEPVESRTGRRRVLVLGAGGGVGTFAVRLAVLRGADVHALCSARAIEAVEALGAARVDDRSIDLATLEAASYDAVIDLGGVAPLRSLQRLLRDGGALVGVSGGTNPVFGPLGRMLRAAVLSIGSNRPLKSLAAVTKPAITEQLLQPAASGRLVPVVQQTFTHDAAPDALAQLDAGGVVGKLLVATDA